MNLQLPRQWTHFKPASVFQITRRLEFPSHWPNTGAPPTTPLRRLSPVPYVSHDLFDTNFIHTRPLYAGPNKFSQVYLGTLVSPSIGTVQKTVLKIFNPELFSYAVTPDPEDIFENPLPISNKSYRFTDELLAWTETWAYNKLACLQGGIIPQYIGTYMVKSPPSDQEHMAVAMSYISGTPIIKKCEQQQFQAEGQFKWYTFARDIFKTAYDIHQLGVCCLDYHGGNIFAADDTSSKKTSCSIALIDFAATRPTSFPSSELHKLHEVDFAMRTDMQQIVRLLYDMSGPEDSLANVRERNWGFYEWVMKTHPDDAWIQAWYPLIMKQQPKNS